MKETGWAYRPQVLPSSITMRFGYIQVYQEKMSILGGQSISHSKQRVYMYMCPTSDGFSYRVTSLYSFKIVDKEILHIVYNTGIYCSSYKVDTVYLVQ